MTAIYSRDIIQYVNGPFMTIANNDRRWHYAEKKILNVICERSCNKEIFVYK